MGECLTFGLTGVLLNLGFSEWDRCHFLLLTPHSFKRVPAIQITEKLCPKYNDSARHIMPSQCIKSEQMIPFRLSKK